MLIGSNLEDHSYILVDKGCELPRLAGLGDTSIATSLDRLFVLFYGVY